MKPGPKTHATGARRRIGGRGPYVRADLLTMLEHWRDVYGVPLGRSLDAALLAVKDNPQFKIPLGKKKSLTG
jgi:hypothetical protein